MFLYNAPYPDLVTSTSFRPAVYMPSRSYDDKSDPETNITDPCCMLDADVQRNPSTTISSYPAVNVRTYYNNTCTLTNIGIYKIPNTFSTSAPWKLIGMWLYTILPIGSGYSRVRIADADSSWVYFDAPESFGPNPTAFGVGVNVCLDPVYMRWVGGPLRMTQDPQEELAIRQPTSMGIVISDLVTNDANGGHTPVAQYWLGGLYRNNDMSPVLLGPPTNPDGTAASTSLALNDSPNWVAFGKHSYIGNWFFPTFQTFVPNVQYRLVGAQVKGRMLPTDRTRRTY
jgi:hypothetical protein